MATFNYMNATQEKALFHLAGKKNIAEPGVETWQEMTERYPYFAPAQFFLALHLKQEGNAAASGQLIKTNIYFTNPLWLNFQLHDQSGKSSRTPEKQAPETIAVPTVEAVREMMRNIDKTHTITDEPEAFAPEEDASMEDEPVSEIAGSPENKISSILSGQLADFKKPVEADARLDIEANEERLHTIDYFASQGIRIDLSKMPQDKLTTHLRKFTDWLKQMKNPETGPADLGTSVEMENAVTEIARISNVNREVLTEAMAEVLVKQGQVEKAIQLFIKLSFINPEKSSYFAARIEQLKGII